MPLQFCNSSSDRDVSYAIFPAHKIWNRVFNCMIKGLIRSRGSKILAVCLKMDLLVISIVLVYSLSCVKLKEIIFVKGSYITPRILKVWISDDKTKCLITALAYISSSSSIFLVAILVDGKLLIRAVEHLSFWINLCEFKFHSLSFISAATIISLDCTQNQRQLVHQRPL